MEKYFIFKNKCDKQVTGGRLTEKRIFIFVRNGEVLRIHVFRDTHGKFACLEEPEKWNDTRATAHKITSEAELAFIVSLFQRKQSAIPERLVLVSDTPSKTRLWQRAAAVLAMAGTALVQIAFCVLSL